MKILQAWIRRVLNAVGIRNDEVGRVGDERRRVHSFASQRERALSDLGSIALLEESLASERSRALDRGASDPILIESRALVAAAKENNLFYDIARIPGVRVSLRSGESSVFWNASDSSYYKIKNPFAKLHLKKHQPSDVIFEHVVHNILFPEVELEFLGIGEELGEARFVFKQRGVRSDRRPTDAQINQHMVGIGLYPEARYCFGNEQLFVTDVLASSDNVLLGDDDRCYVIDPIIGFKKSAQDVIKELVDEEDFCFRGRKLMFRELVFAFLLVCCLGCVSEKDAIAYVDCKGGIEVDGCRMTLVDFGDWVEKQCKGSHRVCITLVGMQSEMRIIDISKIIWTPRARGLKVDFYIFDAEGSKVDLSYASTHPDWDSILFFDSDNLFWIQDCLLEECLPTSEILRATGDAMPFSWKEDENWAGKTLLVVGSGNLPISRLIEVLRKVQVLGAHKVVFCCW